MPFCAYCGKPTADDAAYCVRCGRPIAPASGELEPDPAMTQPVRAGSSRVLPPPATFQGPGAQTPVHNAGDPIDLPALLRRLLGGSWVDPALVAGACVGVAGLLSTLIAVLVKPTDFGLSHSLTLVAWLTTGAFGADLHLDTVAPGTSLSASLGVASLTVTLSSLGCAAWVFRRRTRRHPNAGAALFDAVRAALLAAVALLVLALAFGSGGREFGRGWGAELARGLDARLDFSPSALGACLGGFLLVLTACTAATLLRSDWWPERLRRAADLLTAPAYGVATFALLLPVAGLLGLVLTLLTGDTVEDSDPTDGGVAATIGLLLALVANGGYWFLGLGTGAAFGARGEGSDGSSDRDVHHLAYYADEAWGLWLAPVIVLAVVLLTTRAVVRRSAPERLVRNLGIWVGLVALTSPLWTYASALHGEMRAAAFGQTFTGQGVIGVIGWQVTLLMTLLTAAAAALFLWRAGRLGEVRAWLVSFGAPAESRVPPPPPPG